MEVEKNKKNLQKRNIERKKMYFCKLIIKCIVYDRLFKNSREMEEKQGRDCQFPCVYFVF